MRRLQDEAVQFSKYSIIGFFSNITLYTLFIIIVYFGISPMIASVFCYILGITLSYNLNRKWAFSGMEPHTHDLPRFLIAYGVGLISTMITISLLTIWLTPEIAQLFNIVITAVIIYSMLRILKFGKGAADHAN